MTGPPAWFVQQYRETVACCSPRVWVEDPKGCLRSKELAPVEHDYSHGFVKPRTISGVVERRRQQLAQTVAPALAESVRGSRLLLSDYDTTMGDAACEHGSNGYFDALDVPPWDSWVGELTDGGRSLLIAWVPRDLVPHAERGVEEDVYDMFTWADARRFASWLPAFVRIGADARVPPWLAAFARS